MDYWPEFLKIVVAHALAVASPGPDFALVLRQSLAHGRRAAVWTSLGIGCGISVHIAYSLLGLGYLLTKSPAILTVAKYLGAAYLAWVGVQALRSRPRNAENEVSSEALAKEDHVSDRAAWTTGFLVNVLNPKAALFFISLFPLVVSATTPKLIQAGYGLWMALWTAGWFCLVAVAFTNPAVRRPFLRQVHWVDRALGLVFLGFAASLLFAEFA